MAASDGGESTDENPLILPGIKADVDDGGGDEDAGVNNVGING